MKLTQDARFADIVTGCTITTIRVMLITNQKK
jgi:hypothetical protein